MMSIAKTTLLAASGALLGLMLTGPASAYQAGDWLATVRIANVDPDDSSGPIFIGPDPVPGSGVKVDDALTLDISFAYVFAPNWAVELLLDITSKHDISATGPDLGPLGKIAEVRPLPPSLLLQYHFLPDSKVRPYVGAGINYTNLVSEETSASLDNALGGSSSISLDDSFGLALQGGIELDLSDTWFLTVDLKWIDLDTTAKIDSPAGRVTATGIQSAGAARDRSIRLWYRGRDPFLTPCGAGGR